MEGLIASGEDDGWVRLFSPEGDRLATAGADVVVLIWNVPAGAAEKAGRPRAAAEGASKPVAKMRAAKKPAAKKR